MRNVGLDTDVHRQVGLDTDVHRQVGLDTDLHRQVSLDTDVHRLKLHFYFKRIHKHLRDRYFY